ncbi:GGDEF domain-containing protein [Marinicella meishanensis]|uniref:GGDEF domain-containing protein n=1 Tax=Marinicella meishanensis TaxID=2873263 RepID=UPI001CC1143C
MLNKSAMWLGNVALFFITPFAINNFINGRLDVAIASFFIMVIFALNTITVVFWKRYYSWVSLLVLSPAILMFCYYSIPNQGIIGVLWSFPALVCLYYLLPEKQAWGANVVIIALCTYLAFNTFERGLAMRIFATLSLISAFTAVSIRQINKQQIELHRLAITDSLTGLYNRTLLRAALDEVITHHHKLLGECHLLTLDVDHFKRINDQFGHDQGDEALRNMAHCIRDHVGTHGVVFRHGGEEFIAVLEDLSWQAAKKLAEDIRLAVASIEVLPEFKTTLSIGLARLKPQMNRIDWIRESDRNLYLAKNQGRNQTVAS